MKKIRFFVTLVLAVFALNAQPSGYYDSAEGKTGSALKTALHNIIKNDNHVSYKELLNAYKQTDKKPNGKVWDIYSDVPGGNPPYQYDFDENCGNYSSEGDCYNREHLWAQSWTNDDSYHKTDILHVIPTDGYVNGRRSNYAFGEVKNAEWTSENGSKLGKCKTSGFSGTVFEPIDEYKGDIARALMYVCVRYYQEDNSWSSSDMTNKSVIKDWAMDMLLRWHRDDPVDQKEIDRNNAAYNVQRNRNPFIDNMDYAEMIWDPNWTAIEDYMTMSVNVWPNPATSTINISGENINAVYMYNAVGQLVLTFDATGNETSAIDVNGFNGGIYFLNIISGNGKSVIKKVIINK